MKDRKNLLVLLASTLCGLALGEAGLRWFMHDKPQSSEAPVTSSVMNYIRGIPLAPGTRRLLRTASPGVAAPLFRHPPLGRFPSGMATSVLIEDVSLVAPAPRDAPHLVSPSDASRKQI
jgi:hypothetical protein